MQIGYFAFGGDGLTGYTHPNPRVVLGGVFGCDNDAGVKRKAIAKAD